MYDKFHLAAEAFSRADTIEALWVALRRQLASFGFTGILYGTEAMPGMSDNPNFILNSINDGWLTEKFDKDLFNCDEYVRVARIDPAPILWQAPENLPDISGGARQSLSLDFDYRIITGVTVPMRFCGVLGGSSIGCHAADMALPDFAAFWHEQQFCIAMIVNAFDATLRQRFGMTMFALTPDEQSCLSYISIGLRPKQIAERMRRTDKQVRSILERAKGRLKAYTVEQAVATAQVYGLVTP